MTSQDDYYTQEIAGLRRDVADRDRELHVLREQVLALEAELLRAQREHREDVQRLQEAALLERHRTREQHRREVEAKRVTYVPPEELQDVIAAAPSVVRQLEWSIWEGDQKDEEDALKLTRSWIENVTRLAK